MNATAPNWPRFSEALREHGPQLLDGIDDGTREIVAAYAVATDEFFSSALQAALFDHAATGDLRMAVLATLEVWREIVVNALSADFGIELEWSATTIDTASPRIGDLVVAATPDDR
jgi:hypothetical protein